MCVRERETEPSLAVVRLGLQVDVVVQQSGGSKVKCAANGCARGVSRFVLQLHVQQCQIKVCGEALSV